MTSSIRPLNGKGGRDRTSCFRHPVAQAEDVLLNQAFFTVDADTFSKFKALLDNPLPPTDKLRRLPKTKAPWEK